MSQRNRERTSWLGVCLLVIGIIYLNKQFHWEYFHLQQWLPHYFFSWQSMLIVIGVLLLALGHRTGLTLVLIGAFFLFTDEIIYALRYFYQWWPLALIIVGVIMLTRSSLVQKS